MQLNRAAITSDITTQIYTNTQRLIKGNTVRDRLLNIADSYLNTIDDRNVNNGFLGLDNNGLVDISFLQAPMPAGKYLRDDGTWQPVATGSYIPLAGTAMGSPMTGPIEADYNSPYLFYVPRPAASAASAFLSDGQTMQMRSQSATAAGLIRTFDSGDVEMFAATAYGSYSFKLNGTVGVLDADLGLRFANSVNNIVTVEDGGGNTGLIESTGYGMQISSNNGSGNLSYVQTVSTGFVNIYSSYFGGSINMAFNPFGQQVTLDGDFLFSTNKGIDSTGSGDVLNIGAANAGVINYGNSGTTHNFLGTAIYELQVNSYVTDKLMTLNYGGAAASGIGVGFEIEENSSITGYFKTDSGRAGWLFKAPTTFPFQLKLNNLTAARAGTIQDSTGTFAWLSDIPAAQNLASVLTAGNSTANMAIQSPDTTGQLLVGDGGTSIGYYGTGGNAYAYYARGAITLSATATTINGLTNVGNASATGQRQLRVGQDTTWLDFGSQVSATANAAIYMGPITPTNTNYTLVSTSGGNTILNAVGTGNTVALATGGGARVTVAGNNLTTSFSAATSGSVTTFTWTKPNNTRQTASTNVPGWQYIAGSRQWATGNIATQIEVDWQAVTWSAVGASTFTTGYGHYFRQPIAGTFVTVTNNYAVGVGGYLQVQPGSISGQGIVLRDLVGNTAQSGIYMGVTPAAGNHAIRGDAAANTFVNSSNQVFLSLNGTITVTVNPNLFSVQSLSAATSGAISTYSFSRPSNTGQTASTAISSWFVGSFGRTWLNGGIGTTITTQIEHDWGAGTYATSGGGTLAFTTIYAHKFRAASLGASVTASANYAAGFDGNVEVVGTVSSTGFFTNNGSSLAAIVGYTNNLSLSSKFSSGRVIMAHTAGTVSIADFGTNGFTMMLGFPIRITQGTNQRAGKATMSAGTIAVANTAITANSIVILTPIGAAAGYLNYTITAGVGFTINSSLGSDTRVVSYLILELV